MAQIAIHHNPFHLHRNVDLFQPHPGQTVRGWLDERGIAEFSKPTLCLVDGEPVLRKDWALVVIAKDMVVSFITLPQGGGGGGKILRTVLTIAVMVAAPYAGAALAGTLGVTSAIGTSLITAGIALAGSALVNALIPPPMPSSAISNYNATSPSPTYSLQAQGNQARLGEPIPVERVNSHLDYLVNSLDKEASLDAANAILTTDLQVKQIAYQAVLGGRRISIGGMAKGSGMIHPSMATMLSYITCDVGVDHALWSDMIKRVAESSFNSITGKSIEVWLEENDSQKAETRLSEMCEALLVNAVIEDYRFEIVEACCAVR